MQFQDVEELKERMHTITIDRASQEGPLVVSVVHITSKASQHIEPNNIDKQMQSPYVPPPPAIATHDRFHKFFPSMENFIALLDTYTYNSTLKKVSRRIVKRMKVMEDMEEEVMEQHVLIENTSVDPISTTATNRALAESIEDNFSAVSSKIQAKDMEIVRVKLELEQLMKLLTTPIIKTISFDNFMECARETKKEIHLVQSKF